MMPVFMNFLDSYATPTATSQYCISAKQGSDFAKRVAGDFNPIHDPDSKRFCVPGDLLFAVALQQYGLHQRMSFQFLDLVSADSVLTYPPLAGDDANVTIQSENGKSMLALQYSGDVSTKMSQIESLVKQYVAFSGQNFPHILVPLMQKHNVMINPKRPLVIYESMSFELAHLDFESVTLKLQEPSLQVLGKRGNAKLNFEFSSAGKVFGSGTKNLVLSGLREYDDVAMTQVCEDYLASKSAKS